MLAIVRADLVNGDDIGMLQISRRFGLGVEAFDHRLITQKSFQDHLHGHGAVELHLPRLEDRAHSTAGDLVFQGSMAGDFIAYNAKTGAKLWSFDAQSGIVAAPVSWSKDGRQYITVLVGWGSAQGLAVGPLNWSKQGPRRNISRVLTFALNGKAKLPPVPAATVRKLQTPQQFADAATIDRGRHYYQRSCYACHGPSAISGGVLPDLRYSDSIGNPDVWNAITIDGALASSGMVSFKEAYSAEQLNAIRGYVIAQAHETVRDKGQ